MKARNCVSLLLFLVIFGLTACTTGTKNASSTPAASGTDQKSQPAPAEKSKEEPAKADSIPTVKLTETLKQDPYSFQVKSVKVAQAHNQFKTDQQFVIVEIVTSNHGISNGSIFSTSFTIKDGKGTEYKHHDLGAFNYQGWITPGKYLQGFVLFETPPGVAGLRLIVNNKDAIHLGL